MKHARHRIRELFGIVLVPACIGLAIAWACLVNAEAQPSQKMGAKSQAAATLLSRCVVVVDVASGARVHSDGDCDVRQGPESTFKVPLALMGFDTGILRAPDDPAWTYDGSFAAPERDRKTVDPAIWERDSVVWFSRELVKRMAKQDGDNVLQNWLDRMDYGNRDARGDPGKNNGLTQAWLSSSIQISPNEQVRFLRRMLTGDLPVSERALKLTRAIVPVFKAADGWTIHGKTGSTGRKPAAAGAKAGAAQKGALQERGWFVGWAEKDGRQLAFAIHEHTQGDLEGPLAGPRLREWMLVNFGKVAP